MIPLRRLDDALPEQALVFGSLPPAGRDLDLLVPDRAAPGVAAALEALGFVSRGGTWARFAGCSAQVVDVVPATAWDLPGRRLEDLFQRAAPLEGCSRLTRPAPQHALLILARRAVRGRMPATKVRARVEAILGERPDAFELAATEAGDWSAQRSLSLLRRDYERGSATPGLLRAFALAADLRESRAAPRARLRAVIRAVARRPRLGAVIVLSGLDGSGKSTQAAALRDALERLGFEAVTRWPAIDAPSAPLGWLARTGKRILGGRRRGQPTQDLQGPGSRPVAPGAGEATRSRSALLAFGWTTVLALRGGWRVARATWPGVAQGRVVVCDRYLLDSWVFFCFQYGPRPYRLQMALLALASPVPRRGYLLDLEPSEATRRQPERSERENALRADLYRRRHSEFGLTRLDASGPQEEICWRIALDAWDALRAG